MGRRRSRARHCPGRGRRRRADRRHRGWYGRRSRWSASSPKARAPACFAWAGRPVDVTVESVAADLLGARNTGQLRLRDRARNVDHVALVRGRCDRGGAAAAVGAPAHRGGAGRRGRARRAGRRPLPPRATRRSACCCAARMWTPPSSQSWVSRSLVEGYRDFLASRCRWSRAAIASSPNAARRRRSW